MKRLSALPLVLAFATIANAQSLEPSAETVGGRTVHGRVIIKLAARSADPVAETRRILDGLGGRFGALVVRSWLRPELVATGGLHKGVGNRRGLERIMLVEYTSGDDAGLVAAKLATVPAFEYAEPEYRRGIFGVPNDPQLGRQWYLDRIRALDAWDLFAADSTSIIAIVDTGIEWSHPDLVRAVWRNPGENGNDGSGSDRRSNGADDDGNGFVDDWIGYDFAGRDGRSSDNDPTPGHWHGTHVAGIAAGVADNAIGIAGVAHGARVMALKIADDRPDQPSLANGYDALLYAVRMGASVINCSWGGSGRMRSEQDVIDAVRDAGALVVAAAGNDGQMTPTYPASYPGVLSVASVMDADRRSIFSNYSASVGISAPGNEIYSTLPTSQSPGGYGVADGTSMASPMVAGAAALVRAKYPGLDPAQVSAVLRASADNIDQANPGYQLMLGAGRLNLLRALSTGPDALMAGVEAITVIDSSDDGVIEPGEPFELVIDVRNYLRPADDLRLRLEPIVERIVTVTAGEAQLGALASGEWRSTDPGSFRVVAQPSVAFDQIVALRLVLTNGDDTIGSARIEVTVNPNFGTTRNGRITATLTGNGRVGFNDFPANEQGLGFRYGRSDNLMAEGGLLIGTSASRLADVVRSGEPGVQSQGLQTRRPFRAAFDPDQEAEIGIARFDDAHLHDIQRNGLTVDLTTIAHRSPGRANQLMLLYRITNTANATLERLHCALYLDWDVGVAGTNNQTRLDPEFRLGYTYNVYTAGLPYVGAMLVGNQPMNFMAADNGADPVGDGFYQEEKWQAIASGIRRDQSLVGDCSMIIGAGPISLAPGEDTTISFSLMAGENLATLQAAAVEARAMLAERGMPAGDALVLPTALGLVEGVPNPFSSSTRIEFLVPSEGPVALDVFDAIGRHVATLAEGTFPRGVHAVEFAPENEVDQLYFVRLIAGGETILKKLLRLGTTP